MKTYRQLLPGLWTRGGNTINDISVAGGKATDIVDVYKCFVNDDVISPGYDGVQEPSSQVFKLEILDKSFYLTNMTGERW